MKITNKILLYFSTTTISLTIISSLVVYFLFSEYREEEFQQRQKEKIKYTISLISEYQEMTENLAAIMDKLTIHDFYDEKMLIYDKYKTLIYKSIDDLQIKNAGKLLNNLSPSNQWIETKEDGYDIIAVYIQNEENHFYAISKAYDAFGFSKLAFLKKVLVGITLMISCIVLLVTIFLSKKISKPIVNIAEQLEKLNITEQKIQQLDVQTTSVELKYLIEKFNELVQRTNNAFAFQKHIIHHISHQLKTPIAVLVSELERLEKKCQSIETKSEIQDLVFKTKSLGNIINTLLDISKIETAKQINKHSFRIDEVIYDIIDELNIIHPDFKFDVNYTPKDFSEAKLIIHANQPLIKQAFQNILHNCITYSDNSKAEIVFECSKEESLIVKVTNSGKSISSDEEKFMFNYFFRGENSKDKSGFGLGLVLSKKIFEIHNATIYYSRTSPHHNCFEILFPLS